MTQLIPPSFKIGSFVKYAKSTIDGWFVEVNAVAIMPLLIKNGGDRKSSKISSLN